MFPGAWRGSRPKTAPQTRYFPMGKRGIRRKTPRENATSGKSSSEPATSPRGNVEFPQKHHAKMKFLAETLPCAAKYRDPGGGRPRSGKSGVRDAASQRRTHTAAQSQSVSPTSPPPPLCRNHPISARPWSTFACCPVVRTCPPHRLRAPQSAIPTPGLS